MKKHVFIFSEIIFLLLYFSSCELFDIDDDQGALYQEAVITHYGFDFSEGKVDSVGNNNDGDIVNWSPVDPQKRNKLWYRPNDWNPQGVLDSNNSQKNMGTIPLDSIYNVPTKWDADPSALKVGNSYVVKCLDGYAKFKVIDLGNNNDWWAKVEYQYTKDAEF